MASAKRKPNTDFEGRTSSGIDSGVQLLNAQQLDEFTSFSVFGNLASQAPNVTEPPPRKTHRICIDLRNIWQKVG